MARTSGIDDVVVQNHWRNQPRDPKGTETGGQWTDESASLDKYADRTEGQRSDVLSMSENEFNKLPLVYRGVTKRNISTETLVYVTNDRGIAASHGTVLEFRIAPGAIIYPDTEVWGELDMEVGGIESLENGSAVVDSMENLLPNDLARAKKIIKNGQK